MTFPDGVFAHPDPDAALTIRPTRRAHLVGIAGCGMRAMADVLAAAGWQVSGSDLRPDDAIGERFAVRTGHDAAAIDETIELVIHSDAVPASNPEVCRARELNLATCSYPQAVAHLMQSKSGVAIAGTHGKSTATAMAAEILRAEGLDPTVVCGAVPRGERSGGRLGRSRWMLAEACEYRANFLQLKPQMAVLLGVEHDHFDCFADPADLERAFVDFARRIPREGLIVWSAICAAARRAVRGLDCACESFGWSPSATWNAASLRERRGFYSFEIRLRERRVASIVLNVPGKHNVLNALAAAAVASHCGATGKAMRTGLERFAGLERRIELLCDGPGPAIVDDYAHHPTEVAATLATVRQMYPDRRVWCVFQPHQTLRTRKLLDEFARSLQNADTIIVAPIFGAREPAGHEAGAAASDLVRRVGELGTRVVQRASLSEIEAELTGQLAHADVLVTIGAGDIGTVAHGLRHGFRTFRKAG